jgi:hypothetical protein
MKIDNRYRNLQRMLSRVETGVLRDAATKLDIAAGTISGTTTNSTTPATTGQSA